MKGLIERNLGAVFVVALAFGFFLPGLELVPAGVVLAALALLIFVACFNVSREELVGLRPAAIAAFWAWRYVAVPIALWALCRLIAPAHAAGVLVIALMPAGVSSPALAGLLGGNVALTLAVLVVSTVVTPIVVPAVLATLLGSSFALDHLEIFTTLALTVFAPIALHLTLRSRPRVVALARTNLGWTSVVVIALTMAVVLARRRAVILAGGAEFFESLAVAFAVYALLYAAGWFVPRATRAQRIGLALASGANNVVLGISISLIHFPAEVSLFLVVCLAPWILLIAPARRAARHYANR